MAVLDRGVAVTVAVRVAFRPLAPTNDGAERDSARAAPHVCALAGRGLSRGDGNEALRCMRAVKNPRDAERGMTKED